MSAHSGPNIIEDGLVLALDAANEKSFRGEPTTNLVNNPFDLSGTSYGQGSQWSSDPTAFDKVYLANEITPVGTGATKVYESGRTGYHHLSTYGSGGEYDHTISCYVKPLADITNFKIGLLKDSGNMISFNFVTSSVEFNASYVKSGKIETVPEYPGWYRVSGNHYGRYGGWVGSIGLDTHISYTGTSGGRAFLITGVQCENLAYPTPFVNGTRGSTVATGGGGIDLSNSGNHMELGSVPPQQDSDSGLIFSGADNQSFQCSSINYGSEGTCIYWLNIADTPGVWNPFGAGGPGYYYAVDPSGNLVTMVNAKNSANQGVNFWPTCTGVASLIRDKPSMIALSMVEDSFLKWYVNGSLRSTHAPPYFSYLRFKDGIFRAGQGYSNTGQRFTGKLYEVSYYNRALTDAEILQIFNAKRGRYGI